MPKYGQVPSIINVWIKYGEFTLYVNGETVLIREKKLM
jgi:hypothetical protein